MSVYFLIDEDGTVLDARVDTSSGFEALDQAALSVADVYRFSPALGASVQPRMRLEPMGPVGPAAAVDARRTPASDDETAEGPQGRSPPFRTHCRRPT